MTTRYENKLSGRVILITKQARQLIGADRIQGFVGRLSECMCDLGLKWAYVSRCGVHININIEVYRDEDLRKVRRT